MPIGLDPISVFPGDIYVPPPGATPVPPGTPIFTPETDGHGGYMRWRPRMVRQSVFEDLSLTLINSGWTGANADIPLKRPIELIEFYPDFAAYDQDNPQYNVIAVDDGNPGPMEEWEVGGRFFREYRFNMAMYAETNGVAMSLFSDLGDRYLGLTDSPFISLYNYNTSTPTLIERMEILGFQYARAPLDVAPWEHHLMFAELMVRDLVDQNPVRAPQ